MSDVAERVGKIVMEHLGVEEAKVVEGLPFRTTWGPTVSIPSSW